MDKKDLEMLAKNKESYNEITNPYHYVGDKGIECIDVIEQQFNVDGAYFFCIGNAMKYIFRVNRKDDPIKNLNKAKWYIDKAIELHNKLEER